MSSSRIMGTAETFLVTFSVSMLLDLMLRLNPPLDAAGPNLSAIRVKKGHQCGAIFLEHWPNYKKGVFPY